MKCNRCNNQYVTIVEQYAHYNGPLLLVFGRSWVLFRSETHIFPLSHAHWLLHLSKGDSCQLSVNVEIAPSNRFLLENCAISNLTCTWVSCVVFPDPVSPTTITTWLSLTMFSSWGEQAEGLFYIIKRKLLGHKLTAAAPKTVLNRSCILTMRTNFVLNHL